MKDITAIIGTKKGDIHLTLFASKTPLTVANFVNLAKRGFYDGLSFHRVVADYMIQTGCPDGTGRGCPRYYFQDEFDPELLHDKPGVLSMANAGTNTNGSQFFITHVPTDWLDFRNTVFGCVVSQSDLKVVKDIAEGDRIESIEIKGDTMELFKFAEKEIDEWNSILNGEKESLRFESMQ